MTLEHLSEQKEKYLEKAEYFKRISFDNLAADFQGVVDLIEEIENYIKEKENGKV
jgi:hypothetical protein